MNPQPSRSRQIVDRLTQWGSEPRQRVFNRNQTIHEPGDPADLLFLIESGEIRLYHIHDNSVARMLDILGPDEWFGSAALAQLPTFGTRAVAQSRSVVWAIVREIHDELVRHGDLAVEILRGMSRKLEQAWTDDSDLLFEDCRLRLIKTLLRYSTSPAARAVPDGVMLHITHAQLAQAVGAARETISLCLTRLRRENAVRTGRNQLTYSPDRLRELDVPKGNGHQGSQVSTRDSVHRA